MRFKLSFIALAFFAAANFLPSAQAQPRRCDSMVSEEPNPRGIRNAALFIALYDDLAVTVGLQDGRLFSGEINQARTNDFTLKTQFSPRRSAFLLPTFGPCARRTKHAGDPYAIKELATRLSQQPPAMAAVRLRNGLMLRGQVRDAGDLEFRFVVRGTSTSATP